MTPERWQKVEEVLQATLDRSPRERVSYLDEVCAGDDELRSEAAALISAYEESGDFIEQPAITEDAHVLFDALDHNIGRDIGAYTVLERLGAGGMGEVYLAHDRRLNRRVALKILPAFFAADDLRLLRFQREAQAASALNHPNILTIHEVGEYEETHFIATEFIDGQTLRALIADEELSVAEVLNIAGQVASGLAAAHAAGIVHRDIKPENIMRRADGLVKILDFGIVKLMEQSSEFSSETASPTQAHTEIGVVMGTAGYMSPEQARGLTVDERTDIWSLGVVIYEMLVRRAPFSGDTRMDTMVAILEREPPPLFAFAEHAGLAMLRTVVEKALSKERNERYQTAIELATDLKSVEHELPPLLGKQSLVDVLHVPEKQQLTQWPLVQPQAEQLAQPSISGPGGPGSIVSTHSTPSLPLAEAEGKRSRPNVWWVVGAAVLVIAVFAGTYFYYGAVTSSPRSVGPAKAAASPVKLYSQMGEPEQLAFIREQEQRISAMMGDRPARLSEEALGAIKARVDVYASREATNPEAEKLSTQYARAPPYVPLIGRSFAARKVPVIIGIYLPMIESGYRPCFESRLGAKGLFQFLPGTAKNYGVSQEEMCDVEKMTPAAAAYIADHMAELGDDAESMTLVLLSYNRGATWVRGTLRELRDTDDYQRNFWTLFAHRDQLDDSFRAESAGYVPSFFAAAIIGENPAAFGLQMPPLSTLASAAL